jgi:hypothetical protein
MHALAAGDHDGDGTIDLYLHEPDFPFTVSVLYGKHDTLPDTNDVETIDLSSIGGRASEFLDVTGDGIPELLVTTSTNNSVKVFLGLRGQRLLDQFGSGNDAPHPGQPQWWGKPWAEVWQPKRINPDWFGTADILYPLGDIDFDGIGDICTYSPPWLMFYRGGNNMDSLIDAMIDGRPAGVTITSDAGPRSVAVLGDIDGSGTPTIAVGSNGILFVKPSRAVPQTGVRREIPDGTGPASVAETASGRSDATESLHLETLPNPARGEVRLQWSGNDLYGSARLSIADAAGQELKRVSVAAADCTALLKTESYAAGEYFITLTIGQRSTTTRLVLQ